MYSITQDNHSTEYVPEKSNLVFLHIIIDPVYALYTNILNPNNL